MKILNTLRGRKYIFLSLLATLLFTSSCEKDKDDSSTENIKINEWVEGNMRSVYYWAESIPASAALNFSQAPPTFFESLRNKADRFSWIAKADELEESLSGISTSTGMNFSLMEYDCDNSGNNCQNILGTVRYVIPGSPADQAGVERGMIFTGVNGEALTPSTYLSLLDPYLKGQGFTINLATLSGNVINPTNESITLVSTKIAEPSVHFYSIINTPSGKKVGYLFYNRFLNEKTNELFNAFAEFKAAGVSELVLDLRYNLGGGIAVSGVLAALIKQSYAKDQIFVNYNYNPLINSQTPLSERNYSFASMYPAVSSLTDEEEAIADIDAKVQAGNLNLSEVYILATDNSASASELVIHNLAPYMKVIHIGDTTIGKNEGSMTIEDERTPRQIDWALQPIIVKLADKNGEGDYDAGLVPDYEVNEFSQLPFSPHGSEEDPLIARALGLIDPAMARKNMSKSMATKATQRLQQASFKALDNFNKNISAKPVVLDGTINKERLLKNP